MWEWLHQTVSHDIHNRVNLLRVKSMMQPGRAKQSLKAINEIFAAVSMRDGDQAEVACSDHIRSAAIVALQTLELRTNGTTG